MKIQNTNIITKITKSSKWIWGIIVMLAVLSSFYQFVYEKRSDIFFQITSEADILNIHKPLKDLQILFQEDNIQEKKLNLRIYTIRVENIGQIDILQNHFDQNDNWGIKVEDARIIETRFVDSNTEYIKNNLSLQIHEDNIVKLNKIIFDRDSYFIIEILVLHDINNPPHLYQIGKIAGVQKNNLKISTVEKKEPFLTSLFHGNWIIQVIRVILYFIITMIILLTWVSIDMGLKEKKSKEERLAQAPRIDEPISGSSSSTSRS